MTTDTPLSGAQRALLRRATDGPVYAMSLGDHSAARPLVKRGLLKPHFTKHALTPGRDRVSWTLTKSGRTALLALAADSGV